MCFLPGGFGALLPLFLSALSQVDAFVAMVSVRVDAAVRFRAGQGDLKR